MRPSCVSPPFSLCRYAGDDINKVFWMWRISGGVFPEVPREAEFLSPRDGQLRVDRDASPTFAKSLMYRLSYHRFGEVYTDMRTPPGFDRVRNQGAFAVAVNLCTRLAAGLVNPVTGCLLLTSMAEGSGWRPHAA